MYVTQNVEPNPSSMKEIIQCAGGQVSFAGARNTFNTSIAETVRDKCLLLRADNVLTAWRTEGLRGVLRNKRTKENRPFLSSPQCLFQSESKCEIFVMVNSSNFNMNEN